VGRRAHGAARQDLALPASAAATEVEGAAEEVGQGRLLAYFEAEAEAEAAVPEESGLPEEVGAPDGEGMAGRARAEIGEEISDYGYRVLDERAATDSGGGPPSRQQLEVELAICKVKTWRTA
jgi:hypothetical protein